MSYKGKFIETSAGLKHNVDELLVGILKQILLRYEEIQEPTTLVRVRSTRSASASRRQDGENEHIHKIKIH